MTSSNDPVREHLRRIGAEPKVVKGGIEGLVDTWERFVHAVERGFDGTLDEYLSQLDERQILEETLPVIAAADRARIEPRIAAADSRLRSLTRPAARCLWGEKNATAEGWTAERNWWYFVQPRRPGELLAEDLPPRPPR